MSRSAKTRALRRKQLAAARKAEPYIFEYVDRLQDQIQRLERRVQALEAQSVRTILKRIMAWDV